MPDPTPLPEHLEALLGVAAAHPEASARSLAASTPNAPSHDSVSRALARFAPVQETLRQIKREEFVAAWQAVGIRAVARMDELLDQTHERGLSKEIQGLAIAAGIASEKALLFAGQPTAITQVTSDLRANLPTVLERLARVLQARQAGIGPEGSAQGDALATARDVTPGHGGERQR